MRPGDLGFRPTRRDRRRYAIQAGAKRYGSARPLFVWCRMRPWRYARRARSNASTVSRYLGSSAHLWRSPVIASSRTTRSLKPSPRSWREATRSAIPNAGCGAPRTASPPAAQGPPPQLADPRQSGQRRHRRTRGGSRPDDRPREAPVTTTSRIDPALPRRPSELGDRPSARHHDLHRPRAPDARPPASPRPPWRR